MLKIDISQAYMYITYIIINITLSYTVEAPNQVISQSQLMQIKCNFISKYSTVN